jgi:osmoprotectant transport system ATP-binding protein
MLLSGQSPSGVALRGVTKSFGARRILDAVDLQVDVGETLALVGPSGCGKSTLLRLVNGLIAADAGEVWCAGERVTPETVRPLRLRTGYVIQEGGLFPHLSARRNVGVMARELGWSAERIAARVSELATLVRLPLELLERPPGALSGGQRQRISLMRALMLHPTTMLLDEPLGALDPIVRVELQEELARVFREVRATVLLVTHDMAEACFFAERVVVLREGRVHFDGAPKALLASEDPFVVSLVRSHRNLEVA